MGLNKIVDLDRLSRFKSKILALIPTKTSDLSNDSGFLTSYTETDPTVPSWAKASSKPSYTASDVGAVAVAQGVANANKVLKVNSYGVVVPEDNRFVVTLTPTNTDFSGVMDKTVAEIDEAYKAGKKIVFKILSGTNEATYVDCTMQYSGSYSTYPSFNGFIIYDVVTPNLLIFAYTGTTNNGADATYGTHIYPLATGQWTGGSY